MEDYKNTPEGRDVTRKYADILALSRPDSEESRRRHPRMSLENRAKIFSPFAALRGYDEELDAEKQRSQKAAPVFLLCSESGQITYLPSAAGRTEGSHEIVKVMAKPSLLAVASSRSTILASSVRSSPAIFRVWSTKISVVS